MSESQSPEPESGEVSEVTRLDPDEADTPISDSDHVPVGEETGPDARTGAEHMSKPEESRED